MQVLGSEKNLRAQRQREKKKKIRMLGEKYQLLSLLNKLEGRNKWKVAKMGRKVTTKVIMWGRIGFQNNHFKIFHHDKFSHDRPLSKLHASPHLQQTNKDCSSNI
jgi:hypothetical protein